MTFVQGYNGYFPLNKTPKAAHNNFFPPFRNLEKKFMKLQKKIKGTKPFISNNNKTKRLDDLLSTLEEINLI